MRTMTLATLARLVRGTIVPGVLPPLQGELALVKGLTIISSRVQRGDVYFHLPGYPQPGDGCWPDEAYSRGAVAVVTPALHVEPWAGASRITVPDVHGALERLTRWLAAQRSTPLVAVWGCTATSRILACGVKAAGRFDATDAETLLREIWHRPFARAPQVATIRGCDQWQTYLALTLSQPSIVVLGAADEQQPAHRMAEEIAGWPWNGVIVWADGDRAHLRLTSSWECQTPCVVHASKPIIQRCMEVLRRSACEAGVAIPAAVRELSSPPGIKPQARGASWLAARLLGVSTNRFVGRWQRSLLSPGPGCEDHATVVARPLDEAHSPPVPTAVPQPDTIRPPGLKRHAG